MLNQTHYCDNEFGFGIINYENLKIKIVNQFLNSYNGPQDIEKYSITSEKEEEIDKVADDARVTFENEDMNKDKFISLLYKLDCFYIEAFNRINNQYQIYIKTNNIYYFRYILTSSPNLTLSL